MKRPVEHMPWCSEFPLPSEEEEKSIAMSAPAKARGFIRFNGCHTCAVVTAVHNKVQWVRELWGRRRHRSRMSMIRRELGPAAFDFVLRSARRHQQQLQAASQEEKKQSTEAEEVELPVVTTTPPPQVPTLRFGWQQSPSDSEESEEELKEVNLRMYEYTVESDHFNESPDPPPPSPASTSASDASYEMVPPPGNSD